MIYFKEQYYDSFIEMVDEEMWDAYDANENKLGFEVRRSMAKSLVPHSCYGVYSYKDRKGTYNAEVA